jgi:ubiquinone/menaquinone biosynthesis C-methylase UbiE
MGSMGIDLDAYREQSHTSWAEVAPGWEDRREWLMNNTGRVNTWLVEKADPKPGQTFLEIAAGPGDLGLAVAEHIGEGGHVISSDFSPKMLDVARRNGEARGLTQVEYRVLDAEKMDLDSDSVDGVVCRWGYMLMADPAAAFAETRRVLRNGGPLAFAVWTTPDRNPWAAVPAMTLVERGLVPPPEPGAPGMFAMGDSARITELVNQAGFTDPEAEEIEFEFSYADFDDLWESLVRLAGSFARAITELPDAEREATRDAVAKRMEPWRNEEGSYTAPAETWGVVTS